MNSFKWSILIPTLIDRKHFFDYLYSKLLNEINKNNYQSQVEVLFLVDNGEKTTGAKRNILIEKSKAKYISFFDDDDEPVNDYVKTIMDVIDDDSDVIPINGYVTTKGVNPERWEMVLNNPYITTKDKEGKNVYLRYPNHLAVMKRNLILPYKFKDITYGEDYEWATRLHKEKVFKTETRITKHIYHYKYRG